MRVVSNTSPICNLALIGRLDLLKTQFGSIMIPHAVRDELEELENRDAKLAIERALAAREILPRQVSARNLVCLLEQDLHLGEAEAIALAVEKSADLVLRDETDGRARAATCGLRVRGVLGSLLNAQRAGEFVSLKKELEALRSKAHFFIAPLLEASLLRTVGES